MLQNKAGRYCACCDQSGTTLLLENECAHFVARAGPQWKLKSPC